MWKKLTKPVFATVAVLGLAGAVALPALTAVPGVALADRSGGHAMMGRGSGHVEGRIAYLKAELKITPEQEALWSPLAQAMRESAAASGKLRAELRENRGKPQTAAERFELRARLAEAHAKSTAIFTAAFKPLYDGMSDDQRKSADALFEPHARHG